MGGGRSFRLVRVFGIPIGVDVSWFIFLFLLIWLRSDGYKTQFPGHDSRAFALAVLFAFLFFASILLHELGHAVAATRNGVEIEGIELWMFGGLARMRRDSPTWKVDLWIAVAGPLVTLLIAVVVYAVGVALAGAHDFTQAIDPFQVSGVTPWQTVLADVCLINLILLAFNLLPGLPLDGGRIVRSIVWGVTGDRSRATRITATIGRGLSYLLGALGVYALFNGDVLGGIWSLFLAMMIGQAARGAALQTEVTSRIEHLCVEDVMDSEPVAVPAEAPVERALDDYFLRYRWDWFPVVDASGHFAGLVERERLEHAPSGSRVGDVVAPDTLADFRVEVTEPLEALLGSEPLQRLGAVMAVDRDGVLRGVVTIEQVARALRPVAQHTA
jgi:Zn-dependent protease